uniref:H1.10 linker histone n=1 Tax=Latimeria chalumnae TaxID=7897 RepID=M3XLD9_LATCH
MHLLEGRLGQSPPLLGRPQVGAIWKYPALKVLQKAQVTGRSLPELLLFSMRSALRVEMRPGGAICFIRALQVNRGEETVGRVKDLLHPQTQDLHSRVFHIFSSKFVYFALSLLSFAKAMSTEEQEIAPVAAEELPVKIEKKSVSKKAKSGLAVGVSPVSKKKSGKNQRGKYSQLVVDIIENLGAKNGSSFAKIANEAKKVPWFDPQNGRNYLKYSVKALVFNETLVQVKGTGVNGSFKLRKKTLERQKGEKKKAASSKVARPAARKLVKKSGKAKPKPKAKISPRKEKRSAKATTRAKKKVAKPRKMKRTAGARKHKKSARGKTQKTRKYRK